MLNVNATAADQIEEARARVADLLLEIDYIVLQANPQIEAEYSTKIGYLENDLLKWRIAARRARRRLALAQARANSGETFEADEFEAQLDEELAEWESLLAKSVQAFLEAAERASGTKPMSPSEARELKQLHRELIKRLHPDLHPGQPVEAERFFMVAQAAYECGDLEMLRAIDVATEGMGAEIGGDGLSEDEAAAELELVHAQERVLEQQIGELKRSNPYALKERLEDGEWVVRRTSGLKAQIEEQKAAAEIGFVWPTLPAASLDDVAFQLLAVGLLVLDGFHQLGCSRLFDQRRLLIQFERNFRHVHWDGISVGCV